jgi:hypothetical protein
MAARSRGPGSRRSSQQPRSARSGGCW